MLRRGDFPRLRTPASLRIWGREVGVNPPSGIDDRMVKATVTYVDPDGRSLQQAEEGRETLMRKVLELHGAR